MRAQRHFTRAKPETFQQRKVNSKFEFELECQISSCQTRLVQMRSAGVASDIEAVERELEALQSLSQTRQYQQQALQTSLDTRTELLRDVQAQANPYMEEAFVVASLLEPEDERPTLQSRS